MFLWSFSINLLVFRDQEWSSLIGYATHFLLEVWKSGKCCGNTSRQASVSIAFSSSPKLSLEHNLLSSIKVENLPLASKLFILVFTEFCPVGLIAVSTRIFSLK